jgi:hypothetical protein
VRTDLNPGGWKGDKPPKIIEDLQALEADGWEILSVTTQGVGGSALIIAKREVENPYA